MNRSEDFDWQQLRSELRHCGRLADGDFDWIDAEHDYRRGQVKVQHVPRGFRAERRFDAGVGSRRR